MSICIISDIYAKTKFHYNPQHIDQVKPKREGGGGGGGVSAPKANPPDPPLNIAHSVLYHSAANETPLFRPFWGGRGH